MFKYSLIILLATLPISINAVQNTVYSDAFMTKINTRMTAVMAQNNIAKISKNRHVSDFDFTLNSKPSVTLYFGPTDKKFIELTLNRDSIGAGYTGISASRSDLSFSISATWEGLNYVRSTKHETMTLFKLKSIDYKTKKAEIMIIANLVDPQTGKYFPIAGKASITGGNFDNLIKE